MSLCGYELCQIEVFGRQKFCSAVHRKATARARPEAREGENASARKRYKVNTQNNTGRDERKAKLWPCTSCQGLIYHVSKPRDVCAQCRRDSHLTSIKVVPRADDPLRPAQVYFGTMNVSTRYVDAETVRLLCGVPDAIEPIAAFARQLEGVAIVKQGRTGIDILEALIPVSDLRAFLKGRRAHERSGASLRGCRREHRPADMVSDAPLWTYCELWEIIRAAPNSEAMYHLQAAGDVAAEGPAEAGAESSGAGYVCLQTSEWMKGL